MLYLNYFIHVLLNSKYRWVFVLFIYILIYTLLYNTHTVYCMTEGSDISVAAEAKPLTSRPKVELSNLEQLIHRNIDAYIGDKALIESQQEEIARLTRELEFKNDAIKALDTNEMISTLVFEYDDNCDALMKVCEQYNRPMTDIHPDFGLFDRDRDLPK